jgi:hypothetical protein
MICLGWLLVGIQNLIYRIVVTVLSVKNCYCRFIYFVVCVLFDVRRVSIFIESHQCLMSAVSQYLLSPINEPLLLLVDTIFYFQCYYVGKK